MPTLLIGGYYGAGNVGDEAILFSILHDLRRHDADLNFIVLSHDPGKTSSEHAVESIFWEDINAILDAASRCDLIILGGGGIFHDYWGIDPDKYLRRGFWDITAFGSLPLLAKLLNIPCAILAVGVGPFKSELGREHTRLAFERCQFATVRDHESMEYLLQTGIQLGEPNSPHISVIADIVFGFESRPEDNLDVEEFLEENYSIGKGVPLLGISLRYWESEHPLKERLSLIAQGVKQFLESNSQAHLITVPFQVLNATPHTDDSIVLRELAEIINIPDRIHLINTSITPHFAQALIGRCTAVLGMRFHSIIMGINTGTPVIALSYAPKVQSIMRSIGLEEFCNLSLAPDPDKLEKQLQAIWNKKVELSPILHAAGNRLKADALGHARTVMNMLERIKFRPQVSLEQEFALKQTCLLYNADQKIAYLDRELQLTTQHLAEIEKSRFLKLARIYYRLSQNGIFLYARKLYDLWRSDGLKGVWKRLLGVAGTWLNKKGYYSLSDVVQPPKNMVETDADFEMMLNKISGRSLKGLFIIAEKPVAGAAYTQRVSNLCRALSRQGWVGICTGGQFGNGGLFMEPLKKPNGNVFHVPMDLFRSRQNTFSQLPHLKKYFVVESPHPVFFLSALELRGQGFDIVYEISTGGNEALSHEQAIWFDPKMVEAFIINANIITATSQVSMEKFGHLRQDIQLIPDGFDKLLKILETPKWKFW